MEFRPLAEPLVAEDCNLSGSVPVERSLGGHIERADLSGLSVTDCKLSGMRIDGVLVSGMLAAYGKAD